MTTLQQIEEAEALSRNGDARAVAIAAVVIGIDDTTAALAHPRAHRLLALSAWSKGELREARRHFKHVADLLSAQAGVPNATLATAMGDVALAEYYLGEHDGALALRRRALELADAQRDVSPALLRQLKRRLAQSLEEAGAMAEAARYYAEARPEPTDGADEQIGWLNAMALFSERGGRIVEAGKWYAELAAFLGQAEDAEGAVAALGNAALFALEVDHVGQAAEQLKAMRRRLRTDRKLASRLVSYDVRMLLLQQRGRHAAAAELATRAEQLARRHAPDEPSLASRVALIAGNLREAGKVEAASDWLERHVPSRSAVTSADTALLVELANLRRWAGDPGGARQTLTWALAAQLGAPGKDAKFQVLAGLAELAADDGRAQAAALLGKLSLGHLRETALAVTGGELAGWMRSRLKLYDQVLTQLAAAGRLPEAQWLQLRRWQEVSWELGQRSDTIGDPDAVPFRAGEERLRKALAAIEATSALPRSPSQSEEILCDVSEWLDAVWAGGFETVETMPARAIEGSARGPLITYLPSGDGFRGMLEIEGSRREFAVGLPAADIVNAVLELRAALEDQQSAWRPASEALYRALIAPIDSALAGASRIDFAFTGVMSFIPFTTLSAGGKFLVETADIAVRTGAPAREQSGLTTTFARAAAFGSSGDDDRPLDLTLDEVTDLVKRTGGDLFLDKDFTAEALRAALANGAELLHLAGHFRYEPARPHRSAFLLGDGTELTLATLAGPDYDFSSVKLLVLAACETAIADSLDIGLEGLAGLAQAKGARTVLATLWRIRDASAAHLMRLFYDHLFAAEARDPVAALAQAQREMLRQAQSDGPAGRGLGRKGPIGWHPGDWSGFAAYVGS